MMTFGRKSEERCQETKPVYEEFQPSSEWAQDPSNYILFMQLPGFKKEDIRVMADDTGKLTIRGTKQLKDNRFARFEKSFTAPKDSNVEKMSGKFEDACLSLLIPKAAAVEPEKAKTEMKGKGKGKEKEKTETRVEGSGKPTMEEMEELFKEVKDALQREVAERKMGEKRKEAEKEGSEEHGREETGGMQRRAKEKERGKRWLVWEGREDGWRDWLDRGVVVAVEKVRKNKKVIAVALLAFSVGFYVSRRMRTRR